MMTKRRRLTKIRVANTSSSAAGDGRNIGESTIFTTNEDGNTNEVINETRVHASSANVEASMSLTSQFEETNCDDSDTAEPPVKCRGPTILADIWNQPPEEQYVVKFNKEGQPYGEESSLLSSFIGTIGRNPEMAPQGYSDWRLVPKEYKIRCMNEIKLRFAFPRFGEDHIQKALGRTVKEFRGELKATYYEPNKHNRTSLVNAKPPRVPRDQWLKLLSYWDQDKTKRRAIINKNNQKNQTMPHCSGRQSFAQLRAKKTVDGMEPSRAQIFLFTHKDRKTRDKKIIDEESARAAELMKEKLQELPNGVENTDGKIAWKGDIFDQVIGKEERGGRVRGVGGGVCATKLWGQSNANISQNFMESNEASNELVQQLRNDMKHMQEKHDEEMRQLQEKRDMELKEVRDTQNRLESNISQLLNLFTQRTTSRNSRSILNENDTRNTSG